MRPIRALCFLLLTLTCAATHAQVEPLITGAVSLVTDNSSSVYVRCTSYGNGVCSTTLPFASCANGSTLFQLSAQYCTAWISRSPTCCGFSGFCYSHLCLGGFDPGGNLALGFDALESSTFAKDNIAIGFKTLFGASNGSPQSNVAIGNYSLSGVLRGADNIAIGYSSGDNLVNGSNNIYLGDTGGAGDGDESNTIRIGRSQQAAFIAGINNTTLSRNPQPVFIDANGQLGLSSGGENGDPNRAPASDTPALQPYDDRIASLEREIREQASRLDMLSTQLRELLKRP